MRVLELEGGLRKDERWEEWRGQMEGKFWGRNMV